MKTNRIPGRPRISAKAEAEILLTLEKDLKISVDQLDHILEKHGVKGKVASLQRAYRLSVAHRLLSSIRDKKGNREILASRKENGKFEYVVVDCCNSKKKLRAIRQRLHRQISGLANSSGKVKRRIIFLEHLVDRLTFLGRNLFPEKD